MSRLIYALMGSDSHRLSSEILVDSDAEEELESKPGPESDSENSVTGMYS